MKCPGEISDSQEVLDAAKDHAAFKHGALQEIFERDSDEGGSRRRGGPGTGRCCASRVEPSESVHEISRGGCFLRVGDETRKLNYATRQKLHYDCGTAHFEASPVAE